MLRNSAHAAHAFLLICVLATGPAFALLEDCPKPGNASPKKILIFTDGTGNTKGDRTNVRRLYDLINEHAAGDPRIVTYYDRGVGNFGTKLVGGAVGYGLSRNVRQAYRCLAAHYQAGDQIYLFGFSRGAYTARVLGGLIDLMGVLQLPDDMSARDQRKLVEDLYDVYKKNPADDFDAMREAFFAKHPTTKAEIEVMGVWDTVAALGLTPLREKLHEHCDRSGFLGWLQELFGDDEEECLLGFASERLYQDYHSVGAEDIRKIYHAVSIDERRNAFKIELYDENAVDPTGQTLEQVWFAGVHSDVGGGYEDSNALAGVSLNWMIGLLHGEDLPLPAGPVAADPYGPLHASYDGFYTKADPRIREIKPGSKVHQSVVERMTGTLAKPNPEREPDGKYRPVQLNDCLERGDSISAAMADCYTLIRD